MEYPWQTIIGKVPAKSNGYRIIQHDGHSALRKSDAVEKYEDTFYLQVGSYRGLDIQGFFELHLRAYYPTKSSDLDNALKVILDCLQKTRTIKNDNNCVKIVAEKFVDKTNPRIEFKIITI